MYLPVRACSNVLHLHVRCAQYDWLRCKHYKTNKIKPASYRMTQSINTSRITLNYTAKNSASIIEAKDATSSNVHLHMLLMYGMTVWSGISRKPYKHDERNHTLVKVPQAHNDDHSPTTKEHSFSFMMQLQPPSLTV